MSEKQKSSGEIIRAGTIDFRPPGLTFQSETAWKLLGDYSEQYPELNEYDTDEEENKFKILSRNEMGEEVSFALISKESCALAVTEMTDVGEWQKRYTSFISQILENLSVSPLSVSHLDQQLAVSWKTKVNHSVILYNAFFPDGDFRNIFIIRMLFL